MSQKRRATAAASITHHNESAKQGPALRAIAEMEALWKEKGSGKSEAELSKTRRAPVDQLRLAPSVFQPRSRAESKEGIEQNVVDLGRVLAEEPEEDLEPILVFPIAGEWWVIDGHCSLQAYKRQKRKTCRIEIFRGSFTEARVAAAKRNSEIKLPLNNKERREKAWEFVLTNKEPGEPEHLTIREIARSTAVPKSTVGRMALARSQGVEGITPEEVKASSWEYVSLVLREGKGIADANEAWDRERAVEGLTKVVKKHLRKATRYQPKEVWSAFYRGTGEAATREFQEAGKRWKPTGRDVEEGRKIVEPEADEFATN